MGEALPSHAHYFVDFGWFRAPGGRRQLLTWHTSGALYLGENVVAVILDEEEVRRRLEGWENHAGTPEGTGWLASVLSGCR